MPDTPQTISRKLDRVLPTVQKPARYTGGEYNSVVKDWNATPYRLALVFPDVYDLGMSNLGLAILYDIVNRQPDMLAERAYVPWVDMLAAMRRENIPLYALESRRPLRDFDVLGFSLPYEQLYTNVLTALDLAGIPLRAAERMVAPTPTPSPVPTGAGSAPAPNPSPVPTGAGSAPTPNPSPVPTGAGSAPAPNPSPVPTGAGSAPTPNPSPVPTEAGSAPTPNPSPVPTGAGSAPTPNPSPAPTGAGSAPTPNPSPVPTGAGSAPAPTPSPAPTGAGSAPTPNPSPVPTGEGSAPTPNPSPAAAGEGPGVGAWPLILAGGSACLNPEPMHAFFDAFFIGEGEEAIIEIMRVWTDARRAGLSRCEALLRLAEIEGVYVPSLYDVSYHEDGTVAACTVRPEICNSQFAIPLRSASGTIVRNPIVKRIVPTLPPPPTKFIVPFLDIVHNRAAIEIQRGCTRGCRFCQAGMIFRPVRGRPLAEVLDAVDAVVRDTGFEEISFLSLSSSDYKDIAELVREVVARHGDDKLSIGLPSLRIESFSLELMEQLEKGRRRSGFTFAPEAATDRLRDVINKPIATEALLDVAREVYRRGWTTIKLYFMIGHPTQTLADVQAIADLAHQVRRIGFQELGKKSSVRVGVSTLVPKPHTPFQWAPLVDEATIREHIGLLERQLRAPGLEFSWNNPQETLIEAVLSRGDRRLADVIQRAWALGAGFDGWGDQFNFAAWMQAFAENGLDPDWYARRERELDEVLPWDHISAGVSKTFLVQEYQHALQGAVIDDCREHCYSCGILGQFKEERRGVADDAWGCPPLGKGKVRQPVSARPVPLYVNEEMSPELAADSGPRVPQRAKQLTG